MKCADTEVAVLALASLANILSYADTLLLTDSVTSEVIAAGIPRVLEVLRGPQQSRPQRFYAAAAIANAATHPRLAEAIKLNGGMPCN